MAVTTPLCTVGLVDRGSIQMHLVFVCFRVQDRH
ncbi:hypothetical protein ACP70R_044380 [Stipagrostis hirtigluma subsp. patula]